MKNKKTGFGFSKALTNRAMLPEHRPISFRPQKSRKSTKQTRSGRCQIQFICAFWAFLPLKLAVQRGFICGASYLGRNKLRVTVSLCS
jgi:hypothetical protein